MIRPDAVVAVFEAISSVLICKSVWQLHKDKLVRGVSVWTVCFFALWGWWNLYWYKHIDAPYAWWAGIGVVAANTTWAVQMVYWVWREGREKQALKPPIGMRITHIDRW